MKIFICFNLLLEPSVPINHPNFSTVQLHLQKKTKNQNTNSWKNATILSIQSVTAVSISAWEQ